MISVNGLKKNYSGFSLDLSMEIPAGRITGIIGKNGAGKSTTLKAILGLIRPDGGSVRVFGKDAGALCPEDKQSIGAAFSDSGFSAQLTVGDVAKILTKLYPACDKERFLRQCRQYGLPEDKLIQKFSTGMKAKLRVLAALSHGAKLLVLDEPTAGMDVEARNEILDIIREYVAADEERSVLVSSHISTDLEGLCDDVYLIHDGKILLHEDTDVILDSYGVLKLSADELEQLDKSWLLVQKKEEFGYSCLTNQRQFYRENYPGLVVESCGIDKVILMMTGGSRK